MSFFSTSLVCAQMSIKVTKSQYKKLRQWTVYYKKNDRIAETVIGFYFSVFPITCVTLFGQNIGRIFEFRLPCNLYTQILLVWNKRYVKIIKYLYTNLPDSLHLIYPKTMHEVQITPTSKVPDWNLVELICHVIRNEKSGEVFFSSTGR